ncbi:malonate decarboxylase gamma subunit [Streptomyces phage ZL12]|uniref:Malonate decarboxylase gamma subunit n=1 Tax=Streptomyces phage ZL12 TaxID=2570911 RepID=D0UWB9_9CAUD|nr:malonate decarboxylase gamma subunit [Streptomyces phage ZL12]ACX71091.1 malonate decarboxylase gamma subunit [Streptomyces phage ZL12]
MPSWGVRNYPELQPPATGVRPGPTPLRTTPPAGFQRDGDTMLGDNTTEHRLRLLQAEFTQHQRRGPGDGRTATRTESPAPVNLGVLDYMAAAVTEVIQHTRAAAPTAEPYNGPLPGLYEWSRENTASLDAGRQQARETLIYRQGLEHAIEMGDTTVVRKHPCPACGCWGLMWRPAVNQAACPNRYCIDDDGLSHAWPLKTLAHHHVAKRFGLKSSAT